MSEMQETAPPEGCDRKFKVVYTIIERGPDKKPVWLRIGAGFINRDQSMNVRLDAVPTNGTLHIRDYVPIEEYRGRRNEETVSLRTQNGVNS